MVAGLAFLLVASVAPAAHAFPWSADECTADRSGVDVVPNFGDVQVRYDVGIDGIRRIMGGRDRAMGIGRSFTIGLTRAVYELEALYGVSVGRSANGYCARATDLTVTYGFTQPIQVLVASELQGYSCGRAAVLEHENRHVEISRSVLAEAMPGMRSALERGMARAGWRAEGATPEAARAALDKVISDVTGSATAAIQKKADYENSRIDTAASYMAMTKSCGKWPTYTDR